MFINEFVNLKCLLTWFSNFLPMLLRCCGIRKTERDFSHFCLSPSSSSPRACETHRKASAASVKNNHSERRMLKSWFHVCRQKEQRASEAAKKIDADTHHQISWLLVEGFVRGRQRAFFPLFGGFWSLPHVFFLGCLTAVTVHFRFADANVCVSFSLRKKKILKTSSVSGRKKKESKRHRERKVP